MSILFTVTKKLSDLTFPWEKLLLQCCHLFTFPLPPTSGVQGFLPKVSSFIWSYCMRSWTTGEKVNHRSAWSLAPRVKCLALSQECVNSDKTLWRKGRFAIAAVHYLWTSAMFVQLLLPSLREILVKKKRRLLDRSVLDRGYLKPLFICTL